MPWILNFAYIISISSKRIMSVQLMYECFFFLRLLTCLLIFVAEFTREVLQKGRMDQ